MKSRFRPRLKFLIRILKPKWEDLTYDQFVRLESKKYPKQPEQRFLQVHDFWFCYRG